MHVPMNGKDQKEACAYVYWSKRRRLSALKMRWIGKPPRSVFDALDDAGYCLDRPDPLNEEEQ